MADPALLDLPVRGRMEEPEHAAGGAEIEGEPIGCFPSPLAGSDAREHGAAERGSDIEAGLQKGGRADLAADLPWLLMRRAACSRNPYRSASSRVWRPRRKAS